MKRGTVDAKLPMWVLGCNPSGPYSFEQVRAMWQAGQLMPDQQYCQQGMKTWCPLSDIVPALDAQTSTPKPGAKKIIATRSGPIRKSEPPAMSPSESSFERGYHFPGARRTLRFRTHL